jgi:Tfp pilus assembly protein PilX
MRDPGMNPKHSQQGATLIVSLVMLVVMTLFAVSAINLSSMNLKIVGNMQTQRLMEMSAQDAIERMISTPTYYSLTPTIQNFTISGLAVAVSAPACVRSVPATGYSATSGISPEDNDWEFVATVTDGLTGAALALTQGVRIRMLAGNCP